MMAARCAASRWTLPTRLAPVAARASLDRSLPLAGSSLAAVLEGLAALREPVLYHPVTGNAGDSAINCAAYQLFERFRLAVEVVDSNVETSRTHDRVLVCAGGGNLVPMYDDVRRFVTQHHAGCRRFVLLPSTVRGHEDLLAQLGPQVTLLCRDGPSLAHVQAHAPGAQALPSHDVVLHLDVGALAATAAHTFLPFVSTWGQARRNARRRWRGLRYDRLNTTNRGELFAFRTDIEGAADRVLPEPNFDVSEEYVSDDMSPALTLEATWRMLGFLDRYHTVHTDRLHVAILSALLGKVVRMHDNSYGKNRFVYEQSLRGTFPTVTPMWAEAGS